MIEIFVDLVYYCIKHMGFVSSVVSMLLAFMVLSHVIEYDIEFRHAFKGIDLIKR